MKIFLTGSSGILGSELLAQLEKHNHNVKGYSSSDIDLGSLQDIKDKMQSFQPDIVIHCAAMTNVDLCEDDRDAAYLINVTASQHLSKTAAELNIGIIYISSCGVYGNSLRTPYKETDDTQPLNYHHLTKLEGEKEVKSNNPKSLIIRTGWLFGGTLQHRKNFVENRRKEALSNPLVKSAADKKGSPTYTLDVALQIIALMDRGLWGTFNVVNEGCASRFEYVAEIIKLLKLTTKIEPVDSNAFPRKANMPDNECLENYNLNLNEVNKMPFWKDSLSNYINSTYKI